MPNIIIKMSYFKPFTSNVFLRNNEAYKLYYLLYLERNIIYLFTTYVKFILLAYSVFFKIEGKRTCQNSDYLMAHED